MYTLRTKLKDQIVAEFLPPVKKSKQTKVIIILDGMPTVPSKKSLLEFFSKKGFWVFHPRYRGTWESGGSLFQYSPAKDVKDVIDGIYNGFTSATDMDYQKQKHYKLKPDKLVIIGTSFGGPAALLNSSDARVDKVIAISSVIDWNKPGKAEPIDQLIEFTKIYFGNGYRVFKNGWDKIQSGQFYNPINNIEQISGAKTLLIHAKFDPVCKYSEAKKFAQLTNSQFVAINSKDHWGLSNLMNQKYYKLISKFINTK